MIKKVVILVLINVFWGLATSAVYANHMPPTTGCDPTNPAHHCVTGYSCLPVPGLSSAFQCLQPTPTAIIGKIIPPAAIQTLGTGEQGISKFLNNLITLIYILAMMVFVFVFLWGALEWLMSGGDKEKVASAQRRLTHAIIGIILLALAFAIISLVGIFTGFKFFV